MTRFVPGEPMGKKSELIALVQDIVVALVVVALVLGALYIYGGRGVGEHAALRRVVIRRSDRHRGPDPRTHPRQVRARCDLGGGQGLGL